MDWLRRIQFKHLLFLEIAFFVAVAGALFIALQIRKMEQFQQSTALSQKHCAGCHLRPEPGILTKAGWKQVLPDMELRLGALSYFPERRESHRGLLFALSEAGQLPEKPLASRADLLALRRFYLQESPDEFAIPALSKQAWPFRPAGQLATEQAEDISLLALHWGQLLMGLICKAEAGLENKLVILNMPALDPKTWQESWSLDLSGIPVHFAPLSATKGILVAMGAGDAPSSIIELDFKLRRGQVLYQSPLRLTHATVIANRDWILSGFGYLEGALLRWKKGQVQILDQEAGYLKSQILVQADQPARSNQPAQEDRLALVALRAQAREAILKFDLGPGKIVKTEIVQKHPAWGFTDVCSRGGQLFALNGDNGDFSGTPYRPYHGLRSYTLKWENAGVPANSANSPTPLTARENSSIEVPGAARMCCADFNGDGSLDIAIASLYPVRPEGSLSFIRGVSEEGARLYHPEPSLFEGKNFAPGALLCEDLDADGDLDLVAGNTIMLSRMEGEIAARRLLAISLENTER